jgi:L-lactate dehydrogenase complex protein LldG
MSSRETILQTIALNKPDLVELPDMDISLTSHYDDVVRQFAGMVEAAGGSVFNLKNNRDLLKEIAILKTEGKFVINLIEDPDFEAWKSLKADELESLDTCYLPAQLGVAENGAMWISEKEMSSRILPFICQHLVLVLDPADIVHNMHEAYNQINTVSGGFGVFIAGPSKTADIEQNLVIGAHGARSLRVCLIDNTMNQRQSKNID